MNKISKVESSVNELTVLEVPKTNLCAGIAKFSSLLHVINVTSAYRSFLKANQPINVLDKMP